MLSLTACDSSADVHWCLILNSNLVLSPQDAPGSVAVPIPQLVVLQVWLQHHHPKQLLSAPNWQVGHPPVDQVIQQHLPHSITIGAAEGVQVLLHRNQSVHDRQGAASACVCEG